jgi:peptidyl-prolyl cis-trans isomerase A (cyclophilin A)
MKTSMTSALALLLTLAACGRRSPEPRFEKEPEAQPAEPAHSPSAGVASAAHEPAAAQAVPPEPVPPATAAVDSGALGKSTLGDAAALPGQLVRKPTSPDPLSGKFSLADATAGLPGKGALRATIDTGYGKLECKLFDDKAPNTVANFVGLARGLRPFWDAKSAAWVKRPLFDGTSFHRAVADFMIQGGDHLGDGSGGVGYEFADELVPGWSHDRAGLLCMANRGPNTNGGQFFITDGAAPHLTLMNTYTIFGECAPLEVIHRIARAPRANPHAEAPDPVVPIKRVRIARK